MRLPGRRVLVTGEASGIGLAVARRFEQEDARVARLDRDGQRLKDGDGVAVVADVADEGQVRDGVRQAAAALGGLDGVVNCAGVASAALYLSSDGSKFVTGTALAVDGGRTFR